jgi:hypothetical protein
MPLFDMAGSPLPDNLIARPTYHDTVKAFKHALKQLRVDVSEPQEICCYLLLRRHRRNSTYYGRLAVWLDGNWSCLHRESCIEDYVPPGLLQEAYGGSRAGLHFFHLETRVTRDLILHI